MPTMPRPRTEAKATNVAFKILGIPPNLMFKRSKEQQKVNRRLNYEETFRVR